MWNIGVEVMEGGGVEEQRKSGDSLLLLNVSMMTLGGPGMVRVLSPVTLSLELHWEEDVSELSVTGTETHREDYSRKKV